MQIHQRQRDDSRLRGRPEDHTRTVTQFTRAQYHTQHIYTNAGPRPDTHMCTYVNTRKYEGTPQHPVHHTVCL